MRLGFHYHVPAIAKESGIYMPGYLGRFIDSLASLCEEVICFLHSPRQNEVSYMDYQIISRNVCLVDIGVRTSALERTLKAKIYTSFMIPYASRMDILLVRGPSPLLPAMVSASPVPTALLLVGDYVTGVNDLPQPPWRKEAIRLWSHWNKWAQTRAARQSLTFVNSYALYKELQPVAQNLHEIRTTALNEEDFFPRPDTCQTAPPYRILYVGRIDRGKGLLVIGEALSLLVAQGENVILDIVGWPEPGDLVLDELQDFAREKGLDKHIRYHGYKPIGPELFSYYRAADIFVSASTSSEGFPRTIWEAMANSLPVVSTDIGSIKDTIGKVAMIVPPNHPIALSEALLHLIQDADLRVNLGNKGLEMSQSLTLEIQSMKLFQVMYNYVKDINTTTKASIYQ